MQRTAHIADRKRDKRMAGLEVSESDIKSISLESSASCNLSIFLHSFDCCMALLHSHCLTWSFDFSCFFRFQSRHAKQIRRLLSPKLNSKCVSNAFGIFIVLLILPSFSPSELDLHSVSVCVCVLSMLFCSYQHFTQVFYVVHIFLRTTCTNETNDDKVYKYMH